MARRDRCGRKRLFATQAEADAAVVEYRRMKFEPKRRAKRLSSYRCGTCGYYHFGHLSVASFKAQQEREGRS